MTIMPRSGERSALTPSEATRSASGVSSPSSEPPYQPTQKGRVVVVLAWRSVTVSRCDPQVSRKDRRVGPSALAASVSAVISRSYAISTAPASPLQLLALTANKTSPQPAGTSVTFTAAATGGIQQYQYKWWLYDGSTWVLLRDWGTATYTWTPATASGFRNTR